MATKKPTAVPGTAVAVKKASSLQVANIQDLLKAQADANAGRIAPGGGKAIRVGQDKSFTLPDGSKTRESIRVVVLDFVSRNEYYEGAYNKDDMSPPACFAINADPRQLAPSANSPDIQNEGDCATCPMNQYGSAPSGAGKACKNTRVLAVMLEGVDGAPPAEDAEIWTIKVSPTALKSFDGFVANVHRSSQMPPIAVVCEVDFSDAHQYPSLTFTAVEPNPNVGEHFVRQEEAREMLNREPDVSGFGKEKAAKFVGKANPKAAFKAKPAAARGR